MYYVSKKDKKKEICRETYPLDFKTFSLSNSKLYIIVYQLFRKATRLNLHLLLC